MRYLLLISFFVSYLFCSGFGQQQMVPRRDRSCFVVNTTREKHTINLIDNFTDRISNKRYQGSTILAPYQVLWLQETN